VAAVIGLFATWLATSFYFVRAGRLNHDEGWYLYAARLVLEGELPYRDFAFFQAPLLPYVYGLAQQLLGAGIDSAIEAGRLTSWLLGSATIALGARLSFERGGRPGALLFLAIAPFTPLLLWAFTTTRTETLNALLLMGSAYLLLRPSPSARASSGALVAAMLAAATRIASLPLAAGVLMWVVLRHRKHPRELALALGPAAVIAVGLAAFLWTAGVDAVFFDLVTRQTQRHDQLQAAHTWSAVDFSLRRMADISLLRAYYGGLPLVGFACTAGAAAVWLARRERNSFAAAAAGLGAFALAGYLPNLIPRVVFPVYFAAVCVPFLVVTAWCAGHLWTGSTANGRRALSAAAAVFVFFQAASFVGQRHLHLSGDPRDLNELRTVARYLARRVPASQTLVTLDTVLAVESRRRVPPGWEMSIFSYFPNRSEADGERLGILTPGRVAASLRDPSVGAVALSDHALGILVENNLSGFRPGTTLSEAELHAALPALARYRLDRVFAHFGQFGENLYVLLPAAR
jgi:hypothetical protein